MTTSLTTSTSATSRTLQTTRATLRHVRAQLDAMDARSAARSAVVNETPADARDAKRRRSLELAEAAGLGPWSCRFVSLDLRPDDLPSVVRVDVPSRSLPFVFHRVEVDTASAIATCDCIAASFGRGCVHVGVGLLYAREAVRAFQEAASDLAHRLRHEGNAAALRPSL